MSHAGFYAINPVSGTYVIDDEYCSLAVRKKGIVVLNANGMGTVTWDSPTGPMLAVRATTEVAVFGGTVVFGGPNMVWNLWGAPGTSVSYWVFDVPSPQPGHYGLQIYNAAGVLTFDSSMDYSLYASYYTNDNVAASPGTVTLPAGKTYAVVMLKSGWEFHRDIKQEGVNSPEGNYYFRERLDHGGVSVNANVIHFGWYDEHPYGDWSDFPFTAEMLYQYQTYGHYAVQALILDVTGY